MIRPYSWKVKSKMSGYDENYLFNVRSNFVYFNEIETRVCLNKKHKQSSVDLVPIQTNTKLLVKHIPLNPNECKLQQYRERSLKAIDEENTCN